MTTRVSQRSRGSGPRATRRSVIAAGGSALLLSSLPGASRAAGRRPNVVFIMADDLGYADLSCYGRREYRTPAIDRLAAEGLLLTQAYSSSPVCSPTRAALITGRHPQRLEVGLPEPIRTAKMDPVGLPPRLGLLPRVMKAGGYATSLVGKWHLGWPPEHGPLACGFDRFFGIAAPGVDYFIHREQNLAEAGRPGLYEGDRTVRRDGYLTDLLADRAIEELRDAARSDQPLFLSLHFTAPHWPWQGPRDRALAPDADLQHRDGGSLATYAEMVGALDAAVGRVLAELDRLAVAEHTLIAFTSDNGGERYSDTWPLRGQKRELLEGGIRVPGIVRWPRQIRPGSRSDQVLASIDWLPTLAAATGLPTDPEFPPDGENLLPVLTGQAPTRPRKLYWRFEQKDQAAMRDGNWKYLRMEGEESLFDLTADHRERANLKAREPATFERLKTEWARWNATMLPYPAGARAAAIHGKGVTP